MRILITGATGFIGSHLASRLSSGHEVFATVRDDSQVAREGIFSIKADLSRSMNGKNFPAKIDAVIHLAQANVPFPSFARELLAVNTVATQFLLDYARQANARYFLLASTGDVYGDRFGRCSETDPAAPVSYYAVTKRAAEMLALAYSDYFQCCIIRLFQPYGPGQSNRLIPRLAQRVLEGMPVQLNEGDCPHMTPVFIDDVTLAIERAVESTWTGILNIAGDKIASMRELVDEIGRALNKTPVFEQTGRKSADAAGDNRLLRQMLGERELVSLADGLQNTLGGTEDSRWRAHV